MKCWEVFENGDMTGDVSVSKLVTRSSKMFLKMLEMLTCRLSDILSKSLSQLLHFTKMLPTFLEMMPCCKLVSS